MLLCQSMEWECFCVISPNLLLPFNKAATNTHTHSVKTGTSSKGRDVTSRNRTGMQRRKILLRDRCTLGPTHQPVQALRHVATHSRGRTARHGATGLTIDGEERANDARSLKEERHEVFGVCV